MTDDARFDLDLDRAGSSTLGVVHAGLVLRLGDMAFPHEGWVDLPLPVLTWWVEGAARLLDGAHAPMAFPFMEGPYRVAVRPSGAGRWLLELVEDRQEARIPKSANVLAGPLLASLIERSEELLKFCDDRDWGGADRERLRDVVGDLRRRTPT